MAELILFSIMGLGLIPPAAMFVIWKAEDIQDARADRLHQLELSSIERKQRVRDFQAQRHEVIRREADARHLKEVTTVLENLKLDLTLDATNLTSAMTRQDWIESYRSWRDWLTKVGDGEDTSSTFDRIQKLRDFFEQSSTKNHIPGVAHDLYPSRNYYRTSLSCLVKERDAEVGCVVSGVEAEDFPEVFNAALSHPKMNEAKNELERLVQLWALYLIRSFRRSPNLSRKFSAQEMDDLLKSNERIKELTDKIIDKLNLSIDSSDIEESKAQPEAQMVYRSAWCDFVPAQTSVPLHVEPSQRSDSREEYLTSDEIRLIDRFEARKSKFSKEEQFKGEKNVERLLEAGRLALEARGFTDENKQKAERLAEANRAMLAGRLNSLLLRLRDREEEEVVKSLRAQNRFLTVDESSEVPTTA